MAELGTSGYGLGFGGGFVNKIPPTRGALRGTAVGLLVSLAVAAFALGGAADALLTPLPKSWMLPTMFSAIGLAIALAVVLAEAVPWPLGRRLTVVAVLAGTLYSAGQVARGLYTTFVFSGEVARGERRFLVTGSEARSLRVVDRSRPGPVRRIQVDGEFVDGGSRGQCVTVGIERAPSGAERLAPGARVNVARDVGPCE